VLRGIDIIAATTMLGGGPASGDMHYTALGDSFSAGLGAENYTGTCDRSAHSFPARWANDYAPASFASAACSGASASSVLKQLTALSSTTTLVSVTVGYDDAGFGSMVTTCVRDPGTSACLPAVKAVTATVAAQLPAKLNNVLTGIKKTTDARVVVLGYPEPFDPAGPLCAGQKSNAGKMAAVNAAVGELDAVIKSATARARDVFADPRPLFAGHLLCDDPSWLTFVTLPLTASFHPTPAGQVAYEQAFAQDARQQQP